MNFLLIFWMVIIGIVIIAKSIYIFVQALKTGNLDEENLRSLSVFLLLSPFIPLLLTAFVIGLIVSFFVPIPFFEKFKDADKADNTELESDKK